MRVTARPSNRQRAASPGCNANDTSNSGCVLAVRRGASAATTRSKRTPRRSNAAIARARTRRTSSAKSGAPETSARSASMLTKWPTRRSRPGASRPATGTPIAKSSWPHQRWSSAWSAASQIMNVVARSRRPSTPIRATSGASMPKCTLAASESARAGRGRSSGSASEGRPSSSRPHHATAASPEDSSCDARASPSRGVERSSTAGSGGFRRRGTLRRASRDRSRGPRSTSRRPRCGAS